MVDLVNFNDNPTEEEFEFLVRSLKLGKKLPPLTDFFYPADYAEQLIAENYQYGLLEGFTRVRGIKFNRKAKRRFILKL